MAALLFLPHYAEVLEHVVRQAEDEGVVDVECRPDVDPAVVAGQLQAYAASMGRVLRCRPQVGRVEVRAGTGRGRGGRGGHPAAQGRVTVLATLPRVTDRAERWAATMEGHGRGSALRLAHADSEAAAGGRAVIERADREDREAASLATLATRAEGAGRRALDEPPDRYRTCFERDRDRILHASAFRRLSGKTQVFVFPDDHQRTRLTHALEVAQVATSVARGLGLNVALTEAIALGHDCGHGPGGHASEDALSPYVEGGYDHAVWGADVVLAPLNLCAETLDGIRNHSWSRPAPGTPEGEVVSWADRIAYVCHDFEDAVAAGVVVPEMLPATVRARCGTARSRQLGTFIEAMLDAGRSTGRIGMGEDDAESLAAFRQFNYEHIYLRPASKAQAEAVVDVLRALVEHYADRPNVLPADRQGGLDAGSPAALRAAVTYVAGMTDRFAFQQAVALLGWDVRQLPKGIDAPW